MQTVAVADLPEFETAVLGPGPWHEVSQQQVDQFADATGDHQWILQVPAMEEAVEWARRAPFEALSRIYPGEYGATGEIELRRVFELEGFDPSI